MAEVVRIKFVRSGAWRTLEFGWNATFTCGFREPAGVQVKVRYGFGWRYSEHRGHRTQWHSGETVSFRNVIVRFPDERLTVIVLTNRDDPEPYKTALAIADLYLPR